VGEARNGSDDAREAKVVSAREALSLITIGESRVGAEGEGVRADARREPETKDPAPDSRQSQ
jgi:hypothetical protein